MGLTLHSKVVDISASCPNKVWAQAKQIVAYVAWKEFTTGARLVLSDSFSRAEFGPGTFRIAPRDMHYEHIVKINPAKFTLAFVNNDLYEQESLIEWEEVTLTKLVIHDKELFEEAFSCSLHRLEGMYL